MDSLYIQKVLNGNTEAFSYFVSTYKTYAFSLSYSILNNQYLAEEAVQEAYIKAFEKLSTFKQHAQFKTWFGRIVINESFRRSKKNSKIQQVETLPDSEMSSIACSLKSLVDKDQRFYISTTLEKLKPDEALSLELYYLKESSIKEICLLTDWSQSKVKMLLARGRNNFYFFLKQELKDNIKDVL